jgi:hypothetical protein
VIVAEDLATAPHRVVGLTVSLLSVPEAKLPQRQVMTIHGGLQHLVYTCFVTGYQGYCCWRPKLGSA